MKRRHFLAKCLEALIILMAVISAVSCSAEVGCDSNKTGSVSFAKESSKAVDLFAHISYPDAYSLTWTVTATKTDGGSSVGQGVYENVLLTDFIGPFSVGVWTFTLEGFNSKSVKLYEGTATTTVTEGHNTIAVNLNPPTEGSSFIVFENCNFDSTLGQSFRVVIGEGDTLANIPLASCALREDGLYDVPRIRTGVPSGVQRIRIYIGESIAHEMLVRFIPCYETVISCGTYEGLTSFEALITELDAIVEE